MIQPLRAVHRGAVVALALLVPAILFAGLAARSARNRSRLATNGNAVSFLASSPGVWKSRAMLSNIDRKTQPPTIILLPTKGLNGPDLLLYWVSNTPTGSNLPADAHLLGQFVPGRPIPFPPEVNSQRGYLVLYSLAHSAITDTAPLEAMP